MNQFSSRYLVADFINDRLRKHGMRWDNCPTLDLPPSQIQLKLRSLGDEFQERFQTQFDDMVNQLHITEATAYPTFQRVVQELFIDGNINWGRIVALFGFGGSLSVKCVQRGMPQLVDSIVDWVSTYLCNSLEQWITDNGGWQGFVEAYNQGQNHNDSPWDVKGLVKYGAIGVIGAMALSAFLHRT
uniref:Bcl2 protein n=1 Tax=Mytilus galloprovincialis TaxID=29158 RepID=R4JQR8_MYTGA|nr:Bcl2 protein [Mytilus galloprovincialis]